MYFATLRVGEGPQALRPMIQGTQAPLCAGTRMGAWSRDRSTEHPVAYADEPHRAAPLDSGAGFWKLPNANR